MLYVKAINGVIAAYPYTQTDLIRDNPSTSFPVGGISSAALADWNVFPVHFSAPPAINPLTEKVVEHGPLFNGQSWIQQWGVEFLSQAEIDANVAQQASSVRAERDMLLAATDWRVLKAAEVGSVLDPAWIIYRQALRNVPAQPDFPATIIWPEMP